MVGISIDGPKDFHDEYRLNTRGQGTHDSVMRGIRLLQSYGVEWNAMAVVNDYNVDYPEEFYDFFRHIGAKYIQFTPIVERHKPDGTLATVNEEGELTELSVTPHKWGEFLIRVFDRWVRHDVGQIFVQIFDATLARWVNQEPGICTMATVCGHAGVIEHNGDIYSCDHFVFPQYRLGNIHSRTIAEMMIDPRQLAFGSAKRGSLPTQCLQCSYTMICNGECPKNRFATTADGEPGLNYLCDGYRMYFNHVAPYMDYMADQLSRGLPPANVMRHIDEIKKKN